MHVLGMWSGSELDNFMTVKSAWEHDTGATVDWEATQGQASKPDASAPAESQPDIAIVSNLNVKQQLAADGKLVPLNDVLDMNPRHQGLPASLARPRQPQRRAVRHLLQGHGQGHGLVQPASVRSGRLHSSEDVERDDVARRHDGDRAAHAVLGCRRERPGKRLGAHRTGFPRSC